MLDAETAETMREFDLHVQVLMMEGLGRADAAEVAACRWGFTDPEDYRGLEDLHWVWLLERSGLRR